MLTAQLRERIRKSGVPAYVQNIECDEGSEDYRSVRKSAERMARMIRLRPSMQDNEVGPDGQILIDAHDLIVSSFYADIGELVDNETSFEIRHIRSQDEADNAISALASAKKEGWTHDVVINNDWNGDDRAVLVALDDKQVPIGVLAYRRAVSIDLHEDESLILSYNVSVDFIYVKPEARGQNQSSALRRAMLIDVINDIESISTLWRTGKLQKIAPVGLQFQVSAEIETDKGEQFVESLRQNIEEQIDRYFTPDEIHKEFLYGKAVDAAY